MSGGLRRDILDVEGIQLGFPFASKVDCYGKTL